MAIFDDFPYRAYDVLIMEPNQVENGQFTYARMLEDYDNLVSLPERYDTAGQAFPTQKFLWLLDGRQKKIEFYKFLYRVRGRQKVMWVPSWREDIELRTNIAPGSALMSIGNVGFSTLGIDDRKRHLIFIMADGTFQYRRIESAAFVSAQEETLTLNRPFYSGLTKDAVLMVCYLNLARLDNDLIEIRHRSDMDGIATAATLFKIVWDIRNV